MTVDKAEAAEELGRVLVELRKNAGLTVRELAERLGTVSPANISNWSTTRLIPLNRLIQILDEFEVHGDERQRLVGLRRQAEGPGEMNMAAPVWPGPGMRRLLEHESAARRLTSCAMLLLPGILQTNEYAAAIMSGVPDAATRVAVRMGRKKILTRDHDPVELVALIESPVLHRPVVPKEAMVGQLRHLLAMVELPNVEIRILPTTTPGWHPGIAGSFHMIEFPRAQPVVHIEHYLASICLWGEDEVAKFITAAEEITARAMNPDATFETIESQLKAME
jgi:transcriptional regulator with XRE-family HTH domain